MALNDTQPTVESDLPPASQAKRDAIIEASIRLFLSNGYGAVSMDQIAAEAGVSKQTVYSHFGTKDALFGQIIQARCSNSLDGTAWFDAAGGDPKTVLEKTAQRFICMLMTEESITLFRNIISESTRFPELAEAFYGSGPKRAHTLLSAYLAQCDVDGTLCVEDPDGSAEIFFSMLRGDIYLRCILGMDDKPSAEEIDARAQKVAHLFVKAHAKE